MACPGGGDPCAGSRAGGFGGSLLVSKTPADTTKYYPIAAGTSRWQQIRRDTAMDQEEATQSTALPRHSRPEAYSFIYLHIYIYIYNIYTHIRI